MLKMAQHLILFRTNFIKFHMIILQRTVYNFREPRFSLQITTFAISSRGPRLWNKILNNNTKTFTFPSSFQKKKKKID